MSILTKPYFQARKNNGVLWEPDSNTVLWLPGQDDPQSAVIRDRSGYGNNGSISGATWKQLPSGLWGLSHDGANAKVDLGAASSLNFTTSAFTLECWLYLDSIGNYIVMSNATFNVKGYSWHLADTSKVLFRTSQGGAFQDTTSTAAITALEWQHLMVTRSGTGVLIYRNGADITDVAGTHTNPVSSDNSFLLGLRPDNYGDILGDMALVRTYNTAKSATIAADHYAQERHLFGV